MRGAPSQAPVSRSPTTRNATRGVDLLVGTLFFAGIAALPVYVFGSGSIQPSHALLGVAATIAFLRKPLKPNAVQALLFVVLMIVGAREAYELVCGSGPNVLLPAAYFAYALLLISGVRSWARIVGQMAFLVSGVYASVLVALVGFLVFPHGLFDSEPGARPLGTFSNPNQLGYFAVCIGSMIVLLRFASAVSLRSMIGCLVTCAILAMASLSKGAMIAMLPAVAFGGFAAPRGAARILVGVGTAVGGAAVIAYLVRSESALVIGAMERLTLLGVDTDDSLEGRGYTLIRGLTTATLLFGYGSMNVVELIGHEVHSTIAYMLVTYGAIAWTAFMAMLAVVLLGIRRSYGLLAAAVCLGPPLLYGVAHNGLRFAPFWLLVGLAVSLPEIERMRKRSAG